MIFVAIASYRDPDCANTVADLLANSLRPDQIRVGVFSQDDPHAPFHYGDARVSVTSVGYRTGQGACWARAQAYTMWAGESHILQIDSHTRFEPAWDEILLSQLAACPSRRPILTTYAGTFNPQTGTRCQGTPFLTARNFAADDNLSQVARLATNGDIQSPKPTALLSAHFLFTDARWFQEIPYDPRLYFFGEEITLAVRSWTAGWDLYAPSQPVLYHNYERAGRPLHWEDDRHWGRLNDLSFARMRHLLGITPSTDFGVIAGLDRYGLGTRRSLEDYQRFSGINFRERTIESRAHDGDFG